MSEYLKDSGHHDMRTCDSCGGAFYASRGPSEQEEEWTCDTCESKEAEAARLRAALKPFADLSSVYVRRAETFGWKDSDGVYGAADIEQDVTIRVADCRAAIKALENK